MRGHYHMTDTCLNDHVLLLLVSRKRREARECHVMLPWFAQLQGAGNAAFGYRIGYRMPTLHGF